MALLGAQADYQMRHSNKEPDWSSICDTVFDEFLDTDDLFGFQANDYERSSSDDSVNLFDFSGASEQSHHTDATSPLPSWEPLVPEPLQPRAKEPVNFWANTLKALERNAAECESRQQSLRAAKSHPDFLSLGGYPSPPFVPSSPTASSLLVPQRLPRSAANEKRRNITSRSLSRGRPTGVIKGTVCGPQIAHGVPRKSSASPSKMMNPSRYRTGFRDVWADKVQASGKKYELRMPSSALPASPPASAILPQGDEFAAFGSQLPYPATHRYDDFISPLTKTFQQTYIHTPEVSPTANYAAHTHNSYIEPPLPLPANLYSQHVPSFNDTAPLYVERSSSLAPNRIQSFDFGFSSPADNTAFTTTAPLQAGYTQPHDPFGALQFGVVNTIETSNSGSLGLGISCDPPLVSKYSTRSNLAMAPPSIYKPAQTDINPCYLQANAHGLPSTPHRRPRSYQRSQSPSPCPATEPRSSKRASGARKTSRHHRRTKSTNSTPRHPHNADKSGFVNFTPDDSTKLLSGVAPSGSSKTKAKREKEAADKRRRLSQAAIRAVVEAGGDVKALSEAGLLI